MNETESTNDVDLSQFDEEFTSAKEAERGANVPDGRYKVLVDRVEITKSKKTSQPMLKWELRIVEGEHANRKLFRNNMLATKENFSWLKADLKVVQLNPPLEKISDLPKRLNELLDVALEVQVKTKGENTNIYFQKRIPGPNDGGAATDSGSSSDGSGDVPF